MAVGYATLYGDKWRAASRAHQGLQQAARCTGLAAYCNRNGEVIPQRVIDRPPSRPNCARIRRTRIRCHRTRCMDAILEAFIEEDLFWSIRIQAQGFDRGRRSDRVAWTWSNAMNTSVARRLSGGKGQPAVLLWPRLALSDHQRLTGADSLPELPPVPVGLRCLEVRRPAAEVFVVDLARRLGPVGHPEALVRRDQNASGHPALPALTSNSCGCWPRPAAMRQYRRHAACSTPCHVHVILRPDDCAGDKSCVAARRGHRGWSDTAFARCAETNRRTCVPWTAAVWSGPRGTRAR